MLDKKVIMFVGGLFVGLAMGQARRGNAHAAMALGAIGGALIATWAMLL